MELKEVMEQNVFAVVGNTVNEEKYAYKIKAKLLEHGSLLSKIAQISKCPPVIARLC